MHQTEKLLFLGRCIEYISSLKSIILKSLKRLSTSLFEKKFVNNPFRPGVMCLKNRVFLLFVLKLAFLLNITEKNKPLVVNDFFISFRVFLISSTLL